MNDDPGVRGILQTDIHAALRTDSTPCWAVTSFW